MTTFKSIDLDRTGTPVHISNIKSVSLQPLAVHSRNKTSIARSQHAVLSPGISHFPLLLFVQPLLKCPNSSECASERCPRPYCAGCGGFHSLAALAKFSSRFGSLPSSGCFQCPQPRSSFVSGYLKGTLFRPAPKLQHRSDFPRCFLILRRKIAALRFFCEISNAMIQPAPLWMEECSAYVNEDNTCEGK